MSTSESRLASGSSSEGITSSSTGLASSSTGRVAPQFLQNLALGTSLPQSGQVTRLSSESLLSGSASSTTGSTSSFTIGSTFLTAGLASSLPTENAPSKMELTSSETSSTSPTGLTSSVTVGSTSSTGIISSSFGRGAPQFLQNFASGTSFPQSGQITI